MAGKTSHKRSVEETRGRQARKEERGKLRDAQQRRCAQANYQASRLRDSEVADMRARRERKEEYRTIGKAYGLDEFTAARVVRYGKLTPWQAAVTERNTSRIPKQKAYADTHKKEQLPAG